MSQAEIAPPPPREIRDVEEPPLDVAGIVMRLGPGLVIAGSIVGSGELIGTTKTGAEAGFWLLWLIIIGCVIKVFVQVELGRDAIVRGKTTMDALSEVPGPRVKGHGNWLLWYYFIMFAAGVGQLGGIVGGVGQAVAMTVPLTAEGRQFNDYMTLKCERAVAEAQIKRFSSPEGADTSRLAAATERMTRIDARLAAFGNDFAANSKRFWNDDRLWALLFALVTSVLLIVGHYKLIEVGTTALVVVFTMVTVANVLLLQTTSTWAIRWSDIADGLSFHLPPSSEAGSKTALATALKTFGIIGVGANELLAYPYFCIEKGYARFTGPRDSTPSWAARARGWLTVLRWDAWCSMVVYTVATLAFYLLGAAILGRSGLNPSDADLMRTLNVMYEPVFGAWAKVLFLVGAFAVLYSTYFVANAGHSRVLTDALQSVGLLSRSDDTRRRCKAVLSGLLPILCLLVYYAAYFVGTSIAQLVLISGMMQALMLPMLSAAALYFRYYKSDSRVRPGKLWDAFLWISAFGMLLAASVLIYGEISKLLPR
jgi:Mn2+/Fe2+ NRAMP family transporter